MSEGHLAFERQMDLCGERKTEGREEDGGKRRAALFNN